jgi:Circadian oscillating protein COP23
MIHSIYKKKWVIVILLIAILLPLIFQDIVDAKLATFSCDSSGEVPKTVVERVINGGVRKEDFIVWTSSFGSSAGYTPLKRCQEVSPRFNQIGTYGAYITHGRKNNLPIICVTNKEGGGCNAMLFTLNNSKSDTDPKTVIKDLFGVNNSNYSSNTPRREYCPAYISVDKYLGKEIQFYSEVCQ